MKLIIPIAGRGKRVRPHSYSNPKPFLHVAGKYVIDYILKPFLLLNPEEIIIIHDRYTEESVKENLPKLYPNIKFKFAMQNHPLGTAHAIYQAKDFIKPQDDIIIVYADEILLDDITNLYELVNGYDGIIFSREVKDPENYGVLLHENNILTGLIEKPKNPSSNLINVGMYYFPEGYNFINHFVKIVLDKGENEVGEFFLTDAFINMVNEGKKILIKNVNDLDTGSVEKLLSANKILLNGSVSKDTNVTLENTQLFENVSIGKNSKLINCKVRSSIIGNDVLLEGLEIEDSIIGNNVTVKMNGKKFNLGSNSSII